MNGGPPPGVLDGYGNRSGTHGFLLHDGTYTTIDIP
jgi:hypothetical protein